MPHKGQIFSFAFILVFLGVWAGFVSGKGPRQSSRSRKGYHSYVVTAAMLLHFSLRTAGKHSCGMTILTNWGSSATPANELEKAS